MLAASYLSACSFQNFDYLTTDRGGSDSGSGSGSGSSGGGADAATADQASPPDATGSDSHDAGVANDAPVATSDATGAEAAPPQPDAGGPGEGGGVGPSTLVNPSFEQGYLGWTFTPTAAMGKYAYTQYPPTGGYTIDGQYELATWSMTDAFTVRVDQVLYNLPDGTYKFAGHFNCGANNAAYVFSTNCGGPDQRANIAVTPPTGWEDVSITIDVSGGTCEVGFYVDASPTDWLNTDAFSFAIVPPSSADAGGE